MRQSALETNGTCITQWRWQRARERYEQPRHVLSSVQRESNGGGECCDRRCGQLAEALASARSLEGLGLGIDACV